MEIHDEPSQYPDELSSFDPGMTVQLRLTVDFSRTGGRWVPASHAATNSTTGAIAGRLELPPGSTLRDPLTEMTILVNGRPRSVPSRDGRFHLGGLRPGTYRVRLDHESLPIELVPDGESLWVKVAHGAVTQVDFSAALQFGVAGRLVRADGSFVPHAKLRILDEDGNATTLYTDQFGLYRADGLKPGAFEVEFLDRDGARSASARFDIVDDFLLGVDLTVVKMSR